MVALVLAAVGAACVTVGVGLALGVPAALVVGGCGLLAASYMATTEGDE